MIIDTRRKSCLTTLMQDWQDCSKESWNYQDLKMRRRRDDCPQQVLKTGKNISSSVFNFFWNELHNLGVKFILNLFINQEENSKKLQLKFLDILYIAWVRFWWNNLNIAGSIFSLSESQIGKKNDQSRTNGRWLVDDSTCPDGDQLC